MLYPQRLSAMAIQIPNRPELPLQHVQGKCCSFGRRQRAASAPHNIANSVLVPDSCEGLSSAESSRRSLSCRVYTGHNHCCHLHMPHAHL